MKIAHDAGFSFSGFHINELYQDYTSQSDLKVLLNFWYLIKFLFWNAEIH